MDDMISRQAAIDAIRTMQTYKLFAGDDLILVDQAGAQTELMLLPSVQPRPKGQWLPDNRNYYEDRFVCSVCERSYEVDTCIGDSTWDFCPGCGADMREEEQDD